jgi:hypothetical protein
MAGADEDPDAAGAGRRGEDDDARVAEIDRINSKLERLSAQRRALRKAMSLFGDNFDTRVFARPERTATQANRPRQSAARPRR